MAEASPLGLVVLSGDYMRVHYALMMASAAAAIDRPVTLFFTMDAVPAVEAGEGWRALEGAERDDAMKTRGVADFETLLEACTAMEVAFMVCEAGLKARDVSADLVRGDLGVEVTGLVTFYRAVGEGEIVTL
jgi:peroxiredoxin family protein